MIEGQDAGEKHQHTVGNIEVVGSVLSDVFEAAHDVIGAIAHRSGGEWRQAFHGRWMMPLQAFFDADENVSRAALDFLATLDFDYVPAGLEPQKRTHS